MKNFKNLLLVALFFTATTMFGQAKVTGSVVDESGEPLPGASVVEKESTNGTATDFDGKFTLNAQSNSGVVLISFVGYANKEVAFSSENTALGTIQLAADANTLDEIVVKGLIDIAKDRETPVAASTIRGAEIQEKLGSQELPEILNSTPSVNATKSGGGFGDARITIRGFAQENIAVLINGVPVNDMENSKVYWSNWSGLADVTTAMQVQRGLGSSKLAISSVGGTINIITKTTDKAEGGVVSTSFGNDNYLKTVASYSTGKNDNGFATSVLLSRTAGDGYVNGTQFEGYNYFIGMGWDKGDHDFQFMVTGAPQTHNQRTTSFYNMAELGDYLKYGKKYNYNHGYLNGEEFNWRKNFYHKPVVSLNWNWAIDDASSLTTSAYASFGRGGGTGDIGRLPGYKYASSSIFRNQTTGEVMWDDIVAYNQGETVTFSDGNQYTRGNDGGINDSKDNGLTRRASMNSHNWFGLLSNYNTQLNENLSLDVGIDLRSYTGSHYRRLDNLLGANGFVDNDDANNPGNTLTTVNSSDLASLWNVFKPIEDEDKIDYHNDGQVRWMGLFSQLEYKNDDISAFVQAAVSQQGFKRIDYFTYLDSDSAQTSDWQNLMGGNIKGGINWNIDENHNIFGNGGYYSKQPSFGAVFLNYRNDLNADPRNEKIIGMEVGYGYTTSKFKANVNIYRTEWKDRFVRVGYRNGSDRGNADVSGVEQLHTGVEVDFTYKVTETVKLTGMVSSGNWEYKNNVSGTAFDNDLNNIGEVELHLDGVKVGDAPQFTARLGAEFKVCKNFKVDMSQRYVNHMYAKVNAEDFGYADHDGSLELPGYSLADFGASYKWELDDAKTINFRLNVNNAFDTEYIAESATNYHGDADSVRFNGVDVENKAFFGFGRTWNFGVRFQF